MEAASTRNARVAMEEVLGALRDIGIPKLSISGSRESLRASSALVVTDTGFGQRDPFLQVFSLWHRMLKGPSLAHILVF